MKTNPKKQPTNHNNIQEKELPGVDLKCMYLLSAPRILGFIRETTLF